MGLLAGEIAFFAKRQNTDWKPISKPMRVVQKVFSFEFSVFSGRKCAVFGRSLSGRRGRKCGLVMGAKHGEFLGGGLSCEDEDVVVGVGLEVFDIEAGVAAG